MTYTNGNTPNSLEDAANNAVATFGGVSAVTDDADPVVLTVKTSDAGENGETASDGIVDALVVTYSEDVSAGTFTAGNWSFANPAPNAQPLVYANAGELTGSTVKLYVTQGVAYNGGETVDAIISQTNHAGIKDAADNTVAKGLAAAANGTNFDGTATDNVVPLYVTSYLLSSTVAEVEFTELMHASSITNLANFTIAGVNPSNLAFGATNKLIRVTIPGGINTATDRLSIPNGGGQVKDANTMELAAVTNQGIIGGPTVVGLTLNDSSITTGTTSFAIAGRAVSPSNNFDTVKYCIGTVNSGTACLPSGGIAVTPSDGTLTDSKYENFTATVSPSTLVWTGGTYTIYFSAQANNVWGDTSSITVHVTSAVAPVTPTVTLSGASIVSAYTATEAASRFSAGLQVSTTGAATATVNGSSVATGSTVTVATLSGATTLGAHTYSVVVTSTTGHTASLTVAYQVNADTVTPVTPTVTLSGSSIVSAYTATEAASRFSAGLQVSTTGAATATVNGSSVATGSTVTVATLSGATTLGAHTYSVVVTSTTGHTASLTVAYQVNADAPGDTTAPDQDVSFNNISAT
jgi:hypothetical protein